MFKKEAEEYAENRDVCDLLDAISENLQNYDYGTVAHYNIDPLIEECFKDGAEFGYNKANKWHYVKDGDLPIENEYIMIYSKLADNIAVGKRRCAGKIRKRCVYEWYFATYEGTYCLRDKDVIAWKEIELPEEE